MTHPPTTRPPEPPALATPTPTPTPTPPTPSSRLESLDAFRGLTMVAMVLVNNPGTWAHIYPPLRHADWHGCTPTDLIFPFFLFIVGVSMAFSFARSPRVPWGRVARRTGLLLGLGLLLSGFPFFELSTLRLPGVLQRIALCYLAACVIVRFVPVARQYALGAALLLLYWGLLLITPPSVAPDARRAFETLGAGTLSNFGNLSRWLDLQTLGQAHTWIGSPTDPEGLLSTLPAVVTTLIGYWTGRYVHAHQHAGWTLVRRLAAFGVVGVIAGWVWSQAIPLNKPLWTPSYVIFTAGWALLTLAACCAAVDVLRWRTLAFPLVVCGLNAIVLFVASGLVGRLIGLVKMPAFMPAGEAPPPTIKAWLYQELCLPLADGAEINASLLFALGNIVAWYLVLLWLHRRGWHLRV